MTFDNAELTWVSALVFLILSTPTVLLRIYTKATIRALGWDDWTMCMCQIFFIGFLIIQLVGVPLGIGKHRSELSDDEAEVAMSYWYWLGITYIPSTVLLKVSVGLFILRFIMDRAQRWAIIGLCALCVAFGFGYEFVLAFQCKPVSYWWASLPQEGAKCMHVDVFLNVSYAAAAINMVADLLFAALPAWIVWHTRMNLRTRITICILLGLGSIAVIATIARIPFGETYREVYDKPGDFLWKITPIVVLSTVEVGLGVTASSAATLRPLFEKCLGSRKRARSTQASAVTLKTYHFDDGKMDANGKKSLVAHSVSGWGELDDMPDLPFPGQKSAYQETICCKTDSRGSSMSSDMV